MDFLSGNQLLFVKNCRSFKTDFGGILTITYFIIFIFLLYILAQEFFQKKNPIIDYSNFDIHELDTNTVGALKKELNIPIVLGYSKELGDTTRLYSISEKFFTSNLTDCTEIDFSIYQIKPNSSLIYKCFNFRDFVPKLNENDKSYTSLTGLASCSYYNSTIAPLIGLNNDQPCTQVIDPNKVYRIEYYFNYTNFNESLSSEFFSNMVEHKVIDKRIRSIEAPSYIFQQNILLDDQNIIITENNDYIFHNLVSKFFYSGIDFSIKLSINRGVVRMRRTYTKLPEMLAEFLSTLSIFKLVFDILYSIVSHYLFLKFLIKYYFIKYDSEYINSIFNKSFDGKTKLQIQLKEEDLTNMFTFRNYIYASYLKFMIKKQFKIQQCRLLKEEIEKFISIEEYIKSLKKKIEDENIQHESNSNNKMNARKIKKIGPNSTNNYIEQAPKIKPNA